MVLQSSDSKPLPAEGRIRNKKAASQRVTSSGSSKQLSNGNANISTATKTAASAAAATKTSNAATANAARV